MYKSELFLGIDFGGTNIKACVFDANGAEVASASVDTPLSVSENRHERLLEDVDRCLITVIRDVVSARDDIASRIVAIGCCGHGKGLYLVGKKGEHIYPAIASTDSRAEAIVNEWRREGVEEYARECSLQPILACQAAALLSWLRKENSSVYHSIQYVFEAKDYLRYVLTGEAWAEESDYSGTSLMNLRTRTFDPELFRTYGIEEMFDRMPPLCRSIDNCGRLKPEIANATGLRPGTIVSGGMFDIDACLVGSGAFSDSEICVITGTWSINEFVSAQYLECPETTKVSLFCDGAGYLFEESSPTSAGNLEWFRKNILHEIDYQELNRIVSTYEPDTIDTLFLPFLYGTMSGHATGTFSGLSISTTTKDMLRAVFEGVAYGHDLHIKRLREVDPKRRSIVMTGGACKSEEWAHIFSDVMGMPLKTPMNGEIGALGAAMSSAILFGAYGNYHEAANSMVHYGETIMPDMKKHEQYSTKRQRFREMVEVFGAHGF